MSAGSSTVSVRFPDVDLAAVRRAAERRGETLSVFLRRVSLAGATDRGSAPIAGWAALSLTPSFSATVGASLHFTDSGRLICRALPPPPTPAAQFAPSAPVAEQEKP